MDYMLVKFSVKDYKTWKEKFDATTDKRVAHGAKDERVFIDSADTNKVVVLCGWDSKDKAEKYINSEEVRERMRDGGVIDEPKVCFLKDG